MFKEDTFKDKVVLVTGGRSGIGYAIAKLFLQHSATVIVSSRNSSLLQKAAGELSALGQCLAYPCDIRKSENIAELVQFIKSETGKLDVLVNNAGGQFPALSRYIVDKGWNAVINNNLNGTFYMCRDMSNAFFIPQKDGVIVNIIADILRGFPGMIHTGAARAGVENITKTLALEWSEYNIRVTAIAPGTIESSGLETYPKEIVDMFDEARENVPLRRFGTVEDVAHSVVFMASPYASYITGVTLYVDGAQHLNSDKMGLARVMKKMMGES